MSSALEQDREDRPAYVRFERIPVEDKQATLKAGHYVAKDVDMALITPPYSKDVMKYKVGSWFSILEQDVRNNRIPKSWLDRYKESYEAFQKGQDLPVNGTPIRGWGVISPAQQETLIKMQVLTVEDLSLMNDEGAKRVGMGGLDLKNKAKAWLSQLDDKGALTIQMADLQQKFANLEASSEILAEKNEKMALQLKAYDGGVQPELPTESTEISAADVLEDDVPTVKVKRGKR